MDIAFDKVDFDASNPEPRCPCVLLLDTSGSMDGERIAQLNAGLAAFHEDLRKDTLAMLRVEIAIVTFGGQVRTAQEFVEAGQFTPPVLAASGDTPMGTGINVALDLIDARKLMYKANGIPHYRPWIFLITDGAPTDGQLWQTAAQRVQSAETNRKVAFFAVGVEGADMEILKRINPQRSPLTLKGLAFREMFLWLSASVKSISHSEVGSEVLLQQPVGWTKV